MRHLIGRFMRQRYPPFGNFGPWAHGGGFTRCIMVEIMVHKSGHPTVNFSQVINFLGIRKSQKCLLFEIKCKRRIKFIRLKIKSAILTQFKSQV